MEINYQTDVHHRPARSIAYILPKNDYFSEGYRGRVTHALGVIEGLIGNGWKTYPISEINLDKYLKKFKSRLLKPCYINAKSKLSKYSIIWNFKTLKTLNEIYKDKNIEISLTRYAISQPLFNLYHIHLLSKYNIISGLEVNSIAYNYFPNLSKKIRARLLKFECQIFSKYDFIYVVSENMKKILSEGGCKSKIIVLPNASSPKGIKEATFVKSPTNCKTRFIYMGIFQKYYELFLIIKAFKEINKKINDIELHFYGDGPLLFDIKSRIKNHNNIYLHGRFQNENVPKMIDQKSDVLLLPYKNNFLTNVGSPIKLFEYLSLGAPIIASDTGQLPNIIKHKYSGLIYKSSNIESLKNVMEKVHVNRKYRISYGNNALREFNNKHTWIKRFKNFDKLVPL